MRTAAGSRRPGLLGACAMAALAFGAGPDGARDPGPSASGRDIFHREWMPGDPRGHGGDGLGPAFNDTSCVACHNSGGAGGAGPASKNIDILSASRNAAFMVVPPAAAPAPSPEAAPAEPAAALLATNRTAAGAACPPPNLAQLEPLIRLHAGFKDGRTVVLHRFGVDPSYDAFRAEILQRAGQNAGAAQVVSFDMPVGSINGNLAVAEGFQLRQLAEGDGRLINTINNPQGKPDPRLAAATARIQQARNAVAETSPAGGRIDVGPFLVSRSQRNPTPLFGLGLVDAIPESAIVAMAAEQRLKSPETAGRVVRDKEGRVGRLGWKGQTANSEEFVLNACAVEVGLEVPGHRQAITPQAPRYRSTGLDLTAEECASLVGYVRGFPRPVERTPEGTAEARFVALGKAAFAGIGCASCHAPKLGEVEGIYSDLLVHELGGELADAGSYDGSDDGSDEPLVPLAVADNGAPPAQAAPKEPRTARKTEWRTPPLWGLRDSAPYLHDGRAQTIEQAVALHGGQAQPSVTRFFLLTPRERLQVEAFLKTLVAPGQEDDRRAVARAGL